MNDHPGRHAEPPADLLRAQDRVARLYLDKLDAEQASARLQARVELLEKSMAFRLGNALIAALRSPRQAMAVPRVLRTMIRDLRGRAVEPGRSSATKQLEMLPAALEEILGTPAVAGKCEGPELLGDLRVAAVLDEFTAASFMPECQLLNLPAYDFEGSLDEFRPHFLLVESAWRGHDGSWAHRVHPVSGNLIHLVGCCRRRGIPTVFWNKEDPSHFDNFIDAARLFDYVFTTDANCVPEYREILQHERIEVLSFGCQPSLHNPIETEDRRRAASFAGSWYTRYSERSRDFESLVDAVSRVMPVDIYDRNAGRGDPNFAFPSRFSQLIRGHLPYAQIAKAYKGYEVGITINTIKQSPSMCARRVYELLASNTIVASNAAQGLRNTFGDLVLHDDAPDFVTRLSDVHASQDARHRLRLRGLREVLGKHTVAHRLAAVASRVLGGSYAPSVPRIIVIARAQSLAQARMLVATYKRQSWPNKRLQLIVNAAGFDRGQLDDCDDIAIVPEAQKQDHLATGVWPGAWIAMFHPDDHYGSQYLTDLALATRYSGEQAVGKSRAFSWDREFGLQLSGPVLHRKAILHFRSSLVPSAALIARQIEDSLGGMDFTEAPEFQGLAIDEFNYCKGGAGQNVESVDE
ncbi:MAG: CgeB family protein [Lysobacter sp.]